MKNKIEPVEPLKLKAGHASSHSEVWGNDNEQLHLDSISRLENIF